MCKDKDVEINNLQSENEKVVAKALKYRERSEELQEALKQHMAANEELQAKLQAITKEKAGKTKPQDCFHLHCLNLSLLSPDMTTALEKREERLKKKERQLDEEAKVREKAQAELESSRKDHALLQSLTKRQEQALVKKEKTIQDLTEEVQALKTLQEQIFNLSKMRQQ